MPNSSSSLMLRFDVAHAGAVHPLGFFPVNAVKTLMDFPSTSRSCLWLNPETNSYVYPCNPISWPASRIFAIRSGNDSTECAWTNQLVLMLYFSYNLSSRSTSTVAPNMPRETSVSSAGLPFWVLILVNFQ